MGGGLALLDAARHRDCAALVVWSAISTFERHDEATRELWRSQGFLPVKNERTGQVLRLDRTWLDDVEARRAALDIPAACAQLRTPTLLVHGQSDESVPFAEALELEARFPAGVARLLSVAGAGHTLGARHPLREVPPVLERILGATLGHFSEYL
jgi:pimeloyl-ACP methyl ester carboxylesterase